MPLPSGYGQGGSVPLTTVPNDVDKSNPNLPLGAIPTSKIIRQDWSTAPVAASTTAYISTGVAGPNTTTTTLTRGVSSAFDGTLGSTGKPDYARNVVITVTHGTSVVAVSGTITGKDIFGRTITEAWSVTATGTSKTFTGAKAFYQIDSISITAAADASADTIKVGTGAVLGLKYPASVAKLLAEVDSGAVVTTGTIVAGSSSASADLHGTYAPSGAPNGTKTYSVWYISDDPTQI